MVGPDRRGQDRQRQEHPPVRSGSRPAGPSRGERDGRVVITFPDGTASRVDSPGIARWLSEHLGRQVTVARGPPEQHGNLKALGRINDACLGVIASVEQPGRIELGDVALVKN